MQPANWESWNILGFDLLLAGNEQYQMGSSPYVQFMLINVTTVRSIVKVTTVYRSVVLARVGSGIFILCTFLFCIRTEEGYR